MKNNLSAISCMLLLLLTVSCSDTKKTPPNSEPDLTTQSTASESPADPDLTLFDADTLATNLLESKTRQSIDVKKDTVIRFCGGTKSLTDTKYYKITFYFVEKGRGARKIAFFRISGKDCFNFSFTPPANGKVEVLVEEQRALFWKNLPQTMKEPGGTLRCCPNAKKARNRKHLETTGGGPTGTTIEVEQ